MSKDHIRRLARKIRERALIMVNSVNASHIGSCLSIADILAVLYGSVLNVNPKDVQYTERDRFLLSKGHAAAALYAVLAEIGFISLEQLDDYCSNGSCLLGHASHHVPGVEFSTGSLGHALPVACGMALAAKRDAKPFRVFVLLSDGELDEGSNWEAALFASQHQLDNLIVIIDRNGLQGFGRTESVINLEPLRAKWESFGWVVQEIDGHDLAKIEDTLCSVPFSRHAPSVVIANTVKGKGVSFMEDQLAWHYKSPNKEQLVQALAELEDAQ